MPTCLVLVILLSGGVSYPFPEAILERVSERSLQSLKKFWKVFFLADIQTGTFFHLVYEEVDISLTVMIDCGGSTVASCQM